MNSGLQTPATASTLVPYQTQTLHCWKRNFIFHCRNYARILFGQVYGNPITLLEFYLELVNLVFLLTVLDKMNKYELNRKERSVRDFSNFFYWVTYLQLENVFCTPEPY